MARLTGHYFKLSQLHREYRDAIGERGRSESKFFKWVAGLDVLVIDEFGIRSDSDSENRFIQDLIDSRYADMKQTIFIANLEEKEFREVIGERLALRLTEQHALKLIFNDPPYKARAHDT